MSHANSESFRKKISPERDFLIVTQGVPETGGSDDGRLNLSDEYLKDAAVEQVPLVLAVKGPISLRRAGLFDDPSFWMADSYRVTIGATTIT